MAFKRMIAMRRRWEITKKQKSQPLKSTLILEIHKSQRAVKVASFGRSVVVLNEDKIRQYRQLEYEKRLKEKEKRMELQQLKSKRRFGMRTYGDIKSFENAAPGSPTSGGGGSNFDPYSLTVADRIRALKSNYSPADFFRDENGTKRPQTASSKQSFSKDPATPTPATAAMTTTNKDLTNILQKNTHISKPQNSGAEGTSKIKSNLKNMRKLDLQEVLNYAPGTAVYFGATVAIQSRHGGFLSFNNASDIRASAHKILPSARFTIWNCDDLQDHGVVRYGDAVWLQAGVHEVLGAQYGGKDTPETGGMRKIHPALINCRRENFFKAQQYGRWIVLNRGNPTGMLGERVLHHDHIMLEQEWCFIASHTPYDSFMATYNPLEKHSLSNNADFFHPPDECEWKLHLVTLPSDDNPDSRFRQYLLEQAKHQIKLSTQERRKKESVLCQPLRNSLPPELQPDQVVQRHLPHVLNSEANQYHLLSKFDKQMLRSFRSEGNDVKFLKHVYGADSIVYQKAKMAANAQAEEVRNNISKDLLYLSEIVAPPTNEPPQTPLLQAENAYWDAANQVLINTKAWTHLSSSMEKYKDISFEKKDIAARKIQKFLREKMVHFFGWKRSFRKVDSESLRRIRQNALPGPYHPSASSTKVMAKLQKHTPTIIQSLSRSNTCATIATSASAKQLRRPDSAPNFNHSMGRKTTSGRSLLDAAESRPNTAGNSSSFTFLTQDPIHYSSAHSLLGGTPVRKSVLSLCRQRRSSSVSAMLTARKMLFSDQSEPIISNVYEEDDEEDEEENGDEEEGEEENDDKNPIVEGDGKELGEKGVSPTPGVMKSPIPKDKLKKRAKKLERKRRRLEFMMTGLGKTKHREFGLPRDVFQDAQNDVNVSTTLRFLKASSSSPHIYGDVSVKKKSSK